MENGNRTENDDGLGGVKTDVRAFVNEVENEPGNSA